MTQRVINIIVLVCAIGCMKAVDTGTSEEENPTVTPTDPGASFSNEDYAQALRSAAVKLRGTVPTAEDTAAVMAGGKAAYETLIDEYLDPTQANLEAALRQHFEGLFLMGQNKTVQLSLDPQINDDGDCDDPNNLDPSCTTTVNYNEPVNLALYTVLNGLPWSNVYTADYCVDDNLQQTPCTGNLPVTSGIATNQAFLRQYGKYSALAFQRVSVLHQLANCEIYPDSADQGVERCNANPAPGDIGCGPDDPALVWPEDDPAYDAGGVLVVERVHTKFKGLMDGINFPCHGCHRSVTTRANAFRKIDRHGFYKADFTIGDTEIPEENVGKCYSYPMFDDQGRTYIPNPQGGEEEMQPCCDNPDDPLSCISEQDALDLPGIGCCYYEPFTDRHAADVAWCSDPNEPWCKGKTFGVEIFNPADLVTEIVTPSAAAITNGADEKQFQNCQANRFYNYALGLDNGMLGMQAGDGIVPQPFEPASLGEKYRSAFERSNWNLLEYLKDVFKGTEYLISQKIPD